MPYLKGHRDWDCTRAGLSNAKKELHSNCSCSLSKEGQKHKLLNYCPIIYSSTAVSPLHSWWDMWTKIKSQFMSWMTLKLLCVEVFPSHLLSSFTIQLFFLLWSALPPFPCNLRTTEKLFEVLNPHSHQPVSCLCLQVTHLSFWTFSSITFLGPHTCKIIRISSDQVFPRLPPSHHFHTYSQPVFLTSNPFPASLMTTFPLPSSFPCFFNDDFLPLMMTPCLNDFLLLPFLPLIFLVLKISLFSSQRVQYTLFSPLSQGLYASTQPTPFFFILTFDFEVTFNKIFLKNEKRKVRKKASTSMDHRSIYPPAKFSSSGLTHHLRRANRSCSGNTPGVNDCTHLYLRSLAQKYCCAPWIQMLLSVYNINSA